MNNPYEQLYIYYFNGVPLLEKQIETHDWFLGTWVDDDVSFLFFSHPCEDIIDQVLKQNEKISLIDKYEMTGEQWHGDKIEPYFVNDLYIQPPWNITDWNDTTGDSTVSSDSEYHGAAGNAQASGSESIKPILLDPGVVFGTGRHQTTEDCLYLIHRLSTKHSIGSVLDIGTGTGLLSLGAVALGCSRVMACDFNYLAVKTALNNIRLNGFESKVLAFQAKGEEIMSIPCDLLVANIHYDVMQHMIESPHLLEKKWFILSGLLNSEAKKVMDSLSQKNVHIIERRCPDGVWNTILGRSLE